MKLFKKIKNIKRHKRNKSICKIVDGLFDASNVGKTTIVSSRIYNIIYFRKGFVPSNIKEFDGIKNDLEIITVPKELTDFYDVNILRYDEWLGVSRKDSFPDIPSAYPEVFAPKLYDIKPILGDREI